MQVFVGDAARVVPTVSVPLSVIEPNINNIYIKIKEGVTMRKFTIIFVILALLLSLSVPVFAADDDDTRDTVVSFTFEVAEPKYSVEIPASIELKWNQFVDLPVTAEGVADLNGRKIVVGIEDALTGYSSLAAGHPTTDYPDYLIVKNDDATGDFYQTIAYAIFSGATGANRKGNIASVFLEFTEEGSQNFGFTTGGGISTSNFPEYNREYDLNLIYPNSAYKGLVIFGIKVVDAD